MNQHTYVAGLVRVLVACGSAAAACNATAQEVSPTPATAEAMNEAPEVQEVTVTGSRIRGTGPVGSTVIALGAQQVLQQPAATITEYLRSVPQLQGFGVDASSTQSSLGGINNTRGSALNLRGLGPQATLTLIDGQRLTFSGTSGNYADPSSIPSIAIDRIEVVADGASAVYGSDAVAGVVNFLLRKKFDGVQVRARHGSADDYGSTQFGTLAGTGWSSGHVVAAVEISQHGGLNGGDRDYIRSDLREAGGNDFRNSQCNPGNLVVGGISYAIPESGVTPATANLLLPGTRNLCENLRFNDILPSERRNSGYLYAQQDLGEKLSVHVQGLLTNRSFAAQSIQQGSTTNLINLSVPSTNAYYVRPPGTSAATETVEYDFTREIGPTAFEGFTHTVHFTAGLDWTLNDAWHIAVEGLYSRGKSGQWARRIDTTTLNARLRSSVAGEAFNPFGGGNSQAVLDAVNSGVFSPNATSRTSGGSVEADGRMWTMPGGDARLAFGGERLEYLVDAYSVQGTITAPTLLVTPLTKRAQTSGFSEIFVPLVGSGNEHLGLRRLELTAALRHDKYSDVGNTTNPKFGVNYSPVQGLLLKGSYGKSFRAPGLQDLPVLRSGVAMSASTWTDPLSPTGSSQGLVVNAGNPDLTPEKATTWSLGAEFTPPAAPGLRVSLNYFSIAYEDLIGFPPRTTSSLLDANYAFAVTRNPSNALIQSYLDKGIPLTGTRPAVVPWLYDGTPRNLGSVDLRGLDLTSSFQFATSLGEITLGADATYLFTYDFAVTQLAAPVDQAGNINYPVKFRGRAYGSWARDGFAAELSVSRVDSYTNNLAAVPQSVAAWNTVDLHLGYDFPQMSGALSGVAVGFDASNLFDADAPFVNIQTAFDPGQASALGRLLSVSLSKRF
jgi:iron complex outermembrane receptor protein